MLKMHLYGEVDFSSFIVPIKCESNVFFSFPFFWYLIVLFEYTYELVVMFFSLVFYFKVLNYQGETYMLTFVFP